MAPVLGQVMQGAVVGAQIPTEPTAIPKESTMVGAEDPKVDGLLDPPCRTAYESATGDMQQLGPRRRAL